MDTELTGPLSYEQITYPFIWWSTETDTLQACTYPHPHRQDHVLLTAPAQPRTAGSSPAPPRPSRRLPVSRKKNIHRGTQLDSPLYFQDNYLPNRSRHCSRALHPMRQNVPREAEKTRLRTDGTLCRRHYLSPLILFECLIFFRRHAWPEDDMLRLDGRTRRGSWRSCRLIVIKCSQVGTCSRLQLRHMALVKVNKVGERRKEKQHNIAYKREDIRVILPTVLTWISTVQCFTWLWLDWKNKSLSHLKAIMLVPSLGDYVFAQYGRFTYYSKLPIGR